jgi:hypothetical protein
LVVVGDWWLPVVRDAGGLVWIVIT